MFTYESKKTKQKYVTKHIKTNIQNSNSYTKNLYKQFLSEVSKINTNKHAKKFHKHKNLLMQTGSYKNN